MVGSGKRSQSYRRRSLHQKAVYQREAGVGSEEGIGKKIGKGRLTITNGIQYLLIFRFVTTLKFIKHITINFKKPQPFPIVMIKLFIYGSYCHFRI